MRSFFVFLFFCFSAFSFAESQRRIYELPRNVEGWTEIVYKWNDYERNHATTVLIPSEPGKPRLVFKSKVGFSVEGKKKLYFSFYFTDGSRVCASKQGSMGDSIVKVSNQAIKVSTWCKEFPNNENSYVEFTALTMAGESYILDKMRSSDEFITFWIEGVKVNVSNVGFEKAWSLESEEAI